MVFSKYASVYDLLYRDKDYQAEADYVETLIRRFHPEARSIFEMGSGTGIHAGLLARKGFYVQGVERSPDMITAARKNAASHPLARSSGVYTAASSNPDFVAGDIRHIRLEQRMDAVIALFHVMSYQITNEDVLAAFQTARYHLNPGGMFLFDVWYGPAVLTDRPQVRIKRVADERVAVTRLAEPTMHSNENRVDVHYHIFVRHIGSGVVEELQETHVMRYFFNTEIEWMMKQTGFQLLHAAEWLSGKPLGEQTWGACFCLQAI